MVFLISSIICIPLSIIFSTFIHFQLSKINLTLDFSTIIDSFITNKNHFQLFVLTQLFIELILIYFFAFNKNSSLTTETNQITTYIRTPKVYGNGQYGTAKWNTKKEIQKSLKTNILNFRDLNNIKEVTFKSGGLIIGQEKKNNKEKLLYISKDYHSLIIGSTGAGKTRRLLLPSLCNYLFARESVICTDPKGEILQYTMPLLEKLGYKVLTIDFKNPMKSTRYNFLQPVINAFKQGDVRKAEEYCWDITQALVGNEDTKMEKIWKDGEMSIIAGAIMTVVAENMEHTEYQNLTNVYTFISEMCRTENGKMPINYFIEHLPPTHPAINIFGIARIAPEKTRSSFFTSALTTLRLFTSQTIYDMTCESDFDLADLGNGKYFVDIILPDEKLTYYSLAALYTKQQYNALVEYADNHGGKLNSRVNFLMDEFGNYVAIEGFGNMMTVARSRGIFFHLFIQSFSQLVKVYGKEIAELIKDNCLLWIYLKTASFETANEISKKLGNYTTTSDSKSNSYTKYQTGSNSESINLISRPLLTEEEIIRISSPEAIVMITGMYPYLAKLQDFSKYKFNEILGLGDEKKNTEIRNLRENSRISRQANNIQLWGIWNEYI